jgi:hypothetical protein
METVWQRQDFLVRRPWVGAPKYSTTYWSSIGSSLPFLTLSTADYSPVHSCACLSHSTISNPTLLVGTVLTSIDWMCAVHHVCLHSFSLFSILWLYCLVLVSLPATPWTGQDSSSLQWASPSVRTASIIPWGVAQSISSVAVPSPSHKLHL